MNDVELDTLIHRITAALARPSGSTPTDLPPLGEEVDLEALAAFLDSAGVDAAAEFSVGGRRFQVSGDGHVVVDEGLDRAGSFVARCNTCLEEKRGIDFDTAHGFFETHADRSHEAEITRVQQLGPERRRAVGDVDSSRSTGTD